MQATTLYDRDLEKFVVQGRRETNKVCGTDRVYEASSLSRGEIASDIQLIASGAAELRRQANGLTGAVNGRKGLARAKSGQNNRYGVGQAPAKSEEDDDKILRVTDTDITDAQAVLEIMPLSESEAWGPLHPEAIAAAAAASEARRTVANGASGSDSDGIGYGVPTNGGSAARGGSSTGTSSGGEPNDGGVADMDTENGKAS